MMWLLIVLGILFLSYLLDIVVTFLNLKALSPQLPTEFKDVYDHEEYSRSQQYTRTTSKVSLVENSLTTFITIIILVLGGFNTIDNFARSFNLGPISTGLIFIGVLMILTLIISLPFSIYSTFKVEEEFGFNKKTPKLFCTDLLLSLGLGILIGAPLLALILWFFEETGNMAWVYCWIGVILYSFVIQYLAPVLILPLFNKYTPLEEGELRDQILEYTKKQQFKIQGIFTMDGSKRSTKLNAFFTGYGRFRKIAFFDTLIEKLDNDQILAVLAHEMGHYKCRHILKQLCGSIIHTGVMFFFLSLIIGNKDLFQAFGMENTSIYASLVFFGFLFTPVNLFVSFIFNYLSRKHEYEADAYAANTTENTEHMISSLKVLCQENLSNLTPHPLNVLLHYSHPPVLERIKALKSIKKNP
jgi:STE24 endopeptidase